MGRWKNLYLKKKKVRQHPYNASFWVFFFFRWKEVCNRRAHFLSACSATLRVQSYWGSDPMSCWIRKWPFCFPLNFRLTVTQWRLFVPLVTGLFPEVPPDVHPEPKAIKPGSELNLCVFRSFSELHTRLMFSKWNTHGEVLFHINELESFSIYTDRKRERCESSQGHVRWGQGGASSWHQLISEKNILLFWCIFEWEVIPVYSLWC